jgi:hypothetical protein
MRRELMTSSRIRTAPALAAIVVFVAWGYEQGGYQASQWAPGGLMVLALLLLSLLFGRRFSETPVLVRVALISFAAYTLFSFLSMAWARDPAVAFEGANRTLLYLLVFALFASWPRRPDDALVILVAWVLAIVALSLYVLVRLETSTAVGLHGLMPEGRLSFPSGYWNANAALWLMAFWPAVLVARSTQILWVLRGVLAAGAVVLASVALLSQSRGSVLAMALVLGLVLLVLPARVRTLAILAPITLCVVLATPAVLDVGDHLARGLPSTTAMHRAAVPTALAALAAGVLVSLWGAFEAHVVHVPAALQRIVRSRVRATPAVLALLAVGAFLAANDPLTHAEDAWRTVSNSARGANGTGGHLESGVETARYDYFRVAHDEFLAHPLLGIGADNFQQEYLEHRHTADAPRYPHSVELRTLAETGIVGTLLALAGLISAAIVALNAVRGRAVPDRLAGVVASASLAGFAYWLVHGSFDWLWEIAGLGAPAFALLGLACSVVTEQQPSAAVRAISSWFERAAKLSLKHRAISACGWSLLALASATSLAAQWIR